MDRQSPTNAELPVAAPRGGGRTALLHDWLTGFRGGEWILEALCEMNPESDLYTLLYVPGATSEKIESRKIHTSFLNGLPGIAGSYRKFLPLFPLAAERLKVLGDIETMISTSHCVIKGVPKPRADVYHLSYIHSPMRYMYDQFDAYFGPQSGTGLSVRTAAKLVRPYLTKWDQESNKNVDLLVANSSFVRERIRKYYGRDAVVVHPFVELGDFGGRDAASGSPGGKADYFLMVTAFAPNKRVDLAIEAFNQIRLPLKIIGGGQDEQRLRSLAGPTIEFLGSVSRQGVIAYMKSARGFIFPGVEDFGITPLESLAAGTPLIAFKAGGVLETLTEADTEFFTEPTAGNLITAIERFLVREKNGGFSIDQARLAQFSRESFKRKIADLLATSTRL